MYMQVYHDLEDNYLSSVAWLGNMRDAMRETEYGTSFKYFLFKTHNIAMKQLTHFRLWQ